MPEMNDIALLRQYAENNSEEAFAELATRYINLVYSVALRSVGNPHAAEEITQAVFIILAKKAQGLSQRTVLSGWLYQTTRLTAANFLRGEIRRQRREQEAYMQSLLNEPEPEVWPQIAPLLDVAMERLGEKDRNAIVLRYFENKNLREVGLALGASEDAAKMRVNRALEKLRKFFTKRGVALSGTVIAGAVSANSIQAAPVGLAKTISVVAMTKGAAASGSTLTLIKGALKIMAWTKAKTAIVVSVAVILAAGTTPMVIHHYRTNASIFSWTQELSDSDNANYERLTGTAPAEAARTFLEVCGREDWEGAARFLWPKAGPLSDDFKSLYGGMEIVSLGKPFKGKVIAWKNAEYAGIYVPYEIRLKDGTIKKWQLAIRCDNPAKRWYFDGGM